MKARAYAAAVDSAITGIEHLYLVGPDSLTSAQERALERSKAAPLVQQRDAAPRASGASAWLAEQGLGMLLLLSVILLAIVYGIVRGVAHYLRFRPRRCPKGHGNMRLLSEEEDDTEIDEGARFEEQIGSVNYDVWKCQAPGCSERLVIPRRNWMSGYSDCPNCHRRALTSSTVTLVAATQSSTGLEECTTTCAFCKASHVTRHVTPMLPTPVPATSSSSSFGSSSGGSDLSSSSSFGGSGSTSGGGGGASY